MGLGWIYSTTNQSVADPKINNTSKDVTSQRTRQKTKKEVLLHGYFTKKKRQVRKKRLFEMPFRLGRGMDERHWEEVGKRTERRNDRSRQRERRRKTRGEKLKVGGRNCKQKGSMGGRTWE